MQAEVTQHLWNRKAPTPWMATSTLICIILLMSPADQCNAATNNNNRLPTIEEPQLTTSSHNQFASLLAAAQTHFNTTKVCGIRPNSVSYGLPLMAMALSPCAMAATFYSYYKSKWAPYSIEELPNEK